MLHYCTIIWLSNLVYYYLKWILLFWKCLFTINPNMKTHKKIMIIPLDSFSSIVTKVLKSFKNAWNFSWSPQPWKQPRKWSILTLVIKIEDPICATMYQWYTFQTLKCTQSVEWPQSGTNKVAFNPKITLIISFKMTAKKLHRNCDAQANKHFDFEHVAIDDHINTS